MEGESFGLCYYGRDDKRSSEMELITRARKGPIRQQLSQIMYVDRTESVSRRGS